MSDWRFVKQGPVWPGVGLELRPEVNAEQCQFLLGQHSVTFLDPRNFLATLIPPD